MLDIEQKKRVMNRKTSTAGRPSDRFAFETRSTGPSARSISADHLETSVRVKIALAGLWGLTPRPPWKDNVVSGLRPPEIVRSTAAFGQPGMSRTRLQKRFGTRAGNGFGDDDLFGMRTRR